MVENIKSKDEMMDLIKWEVSKILLTANPAIDHKTLKKSLGKASRILYKGVTKKPKKNDPVRLIIEEEDNITTT